ncbi:MAG: hypothetical protein ACQERI_08750, partial [Candidatus Krumholzibacteriota bacterium]
MKRISVVLSLIIVLSLLICCSNDEVTDPSANNSDNSPVASIISPVDSVSFTAGDTVTFSGTGIDHNGSEIPDNSLLWRSDRDGILGTGTIVKCHDLSEYIHIITLTAIDSDNKTDTDAISISICSGGDLPKARISSPSEKDLYVIGETVNFKGSGTDSDDGILAAGSLLWTSDKDGVLGTGASFSNSDLSQNLHVVTLIATDSDGYTGTDNVSINIIPESEIPTAQILSPEDGAIYTEGQQITFSGSGLDSDDGVLSDNRLLWVSDIDGILGTGSSLMVNNLSINSHIVTLTVTDSDSNSDSDSVSVTVEESTIQITTSSLASGSTCSPYSVQLEAEGGTAPYTWELASGSTL